MFVINMLTINKLPKPQTNNVGKIMANKKVYISPQKGDKNWDICYKFNFPYNVLCNFTPTHFHHEGFSINSMEGFLQSLKIADKKTQAKICTLPGFMAKKVGNYLKKSGQFDRKTLYWNGKKIDRYSEELQDIISDAYQAKYGQDRVFRAVLNSSRGHTLTHTIGKNDPTDTILTEEEFINHLNFLREQKPKQNRIKTFLKDAKKILTTEKNTKNISDKLTKYKTIFINDVYLCGENPLNQSKKLKKLGVKTVIDINAPKEDAKRNLKMAKRNNLNYINIVMDDHKKIENSSKTIKQIVELFNEGAPTYIIAPEKKDANIVLTLNYLYNPNSTLADGVMFGTPQKAFISRLSSYEKNLQNEDLQILGWGNKNFHNELSERKNILFELNG